MRHHFVGNFEYFIDLLLAQFIYLLSNIFDFTKVGKNVNLSFLCY